MELDLWFSTQILILKLWFIKFTEISDLKNFQEGEKVESPDIAIAAAAGLSDQEPGESYWKALCQEREKALNDTIEVSWLKSLFTT